MSSLEALAYAWMNHAVRLTWIFTLATALVLALRRPLRQVVGAEVGPVLWLLVPLSLLAALAPHPAMPLEALPPVVVRIAGGGAWVAPPAPAGWTVPWHTLAMAAWLLGALAVLACVGIVQRRYLRRLAGARAIDVADTRTPVWQAVDIDLGPAVVGALGVRIVLPADFDTRYTRTEQVLILAHEQVHALRRDGLWRLLAQGLAALFWFHPLAWYALACLRQDQELACDAAVLREHGAPRRDYASAMLKTQSSPLMLPVGCSWSARHPLTERVAMLKLPVPTHARRLAGRAALGIIALAGSFAVYAAQSAPPVQHAPVAAFTLELAVSVGGQAPHLHATSCLKGADDTYRFVNHEDKALPPWQGQVGIVPAPDGEMEIHARITGGSLKAPVTPILRTRVGPRAAIQIGRVVAGVDHTLRLDLIAWPGCGTPRPTVDDGNVHARFAGPSARVMASTFAERAGLTLVDPGSLDDSRPVAGNFEGVPPRKALQLIGSLVGMRPEFSGQTVRFVAQ